MKIRIIPAILAAAAVAVTLCSCSKSETTGTSAGTVITDCNVGETVTFGSYEQDNDTSDGAEAIEWTVLDKQDGKALLISNYALEAKAFNDEAWNSSRWDTCSLRTWLNDEFYNTAFSSSEQEKIQTTDITDEDIKGLSNDGGNSTQDKVFILSSDEIVKYYNLSEDNLSHDELVLMPTEYAAAHGAATYFEDGSCWWWMRSEGYFASDILAVDYNGKLDYINPDNDDYCVRPALWITLG